MNNLNSILLEGKLVKEPQVLTAPQGKSLCTFTISCERSHKQGEELLVENGSFDIETHGRLAEVCGEYLRAGRGVRVIGHLVERAGQVLVCAEHVEFKPEPLAK